MSEHGVEEDGGVGAMEGGRQTWRPPRRLNRIVTEPKSVCSPRATAADECGCGGALTKRIWSPDEVVRACSAGKPPALRVSALRGSRAERREVRSMQRLWEARM